MYHLFDVARGRPYEALTEVGYHHNENVDTMLTPLCLLIGPFRAYSAPFQNIPCLWYIRVAETAW